MTTTLHELTGLDSDPIDRSADDAEAAVVLDDKDSDFFAMHAHAAVLDAPSSPISIDEAAMLDEPRNRFAAFVTMVLNGVSRHVRELAEASEAREEALSGAVQYGVRDLPRRP